MSFNQIPQQLFDANISLRAKWLWMLIVKNANPESTERWLKQQTYADLLHCSRRSIGRALKELIAAKLLTDLNKRHLYRYKTYRIEGLSPEPREGKIKKISREEAENIKSAKKRQELLELLCTPVPPENLIPKAKEALQAWGPIWKERFPKLDGQAGRPILESCIQKAAKDTTDPQYGRITNTTEFMETWLKTASEWFSNVKK